MRLERSTGINYEGREAKILIFILAIFMCECFIIMMVLEPGNRNQLELA